MRSFYISLFVFILLMCSCKSKKIDSNVRLSSAIHSDLSYLNETVKINTSKTAYFVNEIQNIVIEEDITVTEYDKESGKPIKETKAKRKTIQDSDKVVSETEERGQSEVKNDSLNHIADISKKVESKTETYTKGNGIGIFDKLTGLAIGFGIGFFIIYLLRRFRVN